VCPEPAETAQEGLLLADFADQRLHVLREFIHILSAFVLPLRYPVCSTEAQPRRMAYNAASVRERTPNLP